MAAFETRKNRFRGIRAAGLALLFAGCAVPDYHQPAGFSCTYYRAAQARQAQLNSPVQGLPPGSTPVNAYGVPVATPPGRSVSAQAGVASAVAQPSSAISSGSAAVPSTPADRTNATGDQGRGWGEWAKSKIRPQAEPTPATLSQAEPGAAKSKRKSK